MTDKKTFNMEGLIVFILLFFFWFLWFNRFYSWKTISWILMALTIGGFLIFWIIEGMIIISWNFKNKDDVAITPM